MALQLTKAGFFNPILQELLRRGENIDQLLCRSNLNKFDHANPENYVPTKYAYQFFDATCFQLGSFDLLADFAKVVEVSSLAQWGEMIAYAPDVLSALRLAEQHGSVVNTHEQTGFFIDGNRTTYWQKYNDSADQRGRYQATHISLALAINAMKLAAGKDWAPLEIHLQSQTCPNLDVLLPPASITHVLLGQPVSAFVFETSMISLPMLAGGRSAGENPSFSAVDTLTARIEAVLNSLIPGNTPNLDLFVDMLDFSPRTLQRRLNDEGKTLSQVVEQWRLKTSIHLLQTTSLKVKEISERLCYSNVSNFERAFRRWTQTTPNRYREL